MHVMKAARAPALMQVVDVLCTEIETIAHLLFDGSQRPVRCVGLCIRRVAAAHGIETPYQFGVRLPRLRRGDLLHAMAVPESAGSAKGRKTAFGGDACPGKDEEPVLFAETHKRLLPLRHTNGSELMKSA